MFPPSACPARLVLARMDPRVRPQRRKAPACALRDLSDVFPALPRPASRPLRPVPPPLLCRHGFVACPPGRPDAVRWSSPMHAVAGRTPPDAGLPCYVPRGGAAHTEVTVRRLVRLSCLGPRPPGPCAASPRTVMSGRVKAGPDRAPGRLPGRSPGRRTADLPGRGRRGFLRKNMQLSVP